MKCNVFYNVVYNFSIWSEYIAQVHNSRIEPFRLLKENSVHVYKQFKYC